MYKYDGSEGRYGVSMSVHQKESDDIVYCDMYRESFTEICDLVQKNMQKAFNNNAQAFCYSIFDTDTRKNLAFGVIYPSNV